MDFEWFPPPRPVDFAQIFSLLSIAARHSHPHPGGVPKPNPTVKS
jgi:hypothetical protein